MIYQAAIASSFDLLELHALVPERYPHLLESALQGPQGRFDILFALPGEHIELRDVAEFDFLDRLDSLWRAQAATFNGVQTLPFHGGWFLYLGYELAAQIEPQLRLPAAPPGLPIASATRFPAAVIHDHRTGERWIVAEQEQTIRRIQQDIERLPPDGFGIKALQPCSMREDPPQRYLAAVERILDYIREGDVFQVNLSREWRTDWPVHTPGWQLYRQLRVNNPGPFNGFASWGETEVLSSSPERLVQVRGEEVQTRPIAGTRPRSKLPSDDEAYSRELLDHPKERAEHIMLIDLERNDLGRIAVPGSVRVSELMELESYATVHHIVSNIRARKRADATPGQVIRAVFPGGTITGCPKVRCMQIIAELEGVGRGAYTGSMGYLNRDGSMDLNILIRTMVRTDNQLRFRTGAGIVYDSNPQQELDETRAKAQGMLSTLAGL